MNANKDEYFFTLEGFQALAKDILEKEVIPEAPLFGVVCGSGLGCLVSKLENRVDLSERIKLENLGDDAPNLEIVFGYLGGVPCLCLPKRCHFYQGYSAKAVVKPMVLMKAFGVKMVILSNAAGGLNGDYCIGDFMIIEDHINLMGLAGFNPLIGTNDDSMGPRFPDLNNAYDKELQTRFEQIVKAHGRSDTLRKGCYVCQTGPCYETPSECRFLRVIGGDACGMSTTNEVIACRHLGIKVFAVSLITNKSIFPDSVNVTPPTHEEVLAVAGKRAQELEQYVVELMQTYRQ